MDIGDWLRGLGLSQYEAAFGEHGIDGDRLRTLATQDLERLGVRTAEHRNRLLAAIADLSRRSDASPHSGPTAIQTASELGGAERRHMTIMFCDLVGSTALGARLDPEDMREVLAAYRRCCAGLIGRGYGFVAKYMGDGVLAYFGYPEAHEHDAELAVETGLAIVEAVPQLVTPAGSPLHVRIGIATGVVVVGDIIGLGDAEERGVVGHTANLAARLQAFAEPDSVVIAETTQKLLGGLFELKDLGSVHLKGIAAPTRAWTALRPHAFESRFAAQHRTELTALVGRKDELDLLLECWSQVKLGDGVVILLSGQAGVGKSRLTEALLERLAEDRHAEMRFACSPQHSNSALYPIVNELERAAGLTPDESPTKKLDKLDALLASTGTSPQHMMLFADLLTLSNDGRYPVLGLSAGERRERTLDAVAAQVEALALRTPVLVIFEDAHWVDPTTLDLLGRLVGRVVSRRAMLVVVFRPEFQPPWIGRPHVVSLRLDRLTDPEIGALVDSLQGARCLAANIRREIVERSDGLPLFAEEITRAVLDAQAGGEMGAPSASQVPASLQASLTARLDRAGEAKEIAQIAAAIGREIDHPLLAAVAGKPESELEAALGRLVRAGLLTQQGVAPKATYHFKHSLIRDAAYAALLREPKRALHTRIAQALESRFLDVVASRPEVLARHCTEAGLFEKAARFWGIAGQQSLARSAFVEAAAQLKQALTALEGLPGTTALRRDQLNLQIALLNTLYAFKGFAAPEAKAAMERARTLVEQARSLGEPIESPLEIYSILYGSWIANLIAFNGDAALELARQSLAFAESDNDPAALVLANDNMGISLLATGSPEESRLRLDRAINYGRKVEPNAFIALVGSDVRLNCQAYRALAMWLLGYPDAALDDAQNAIAGARERNHPATLLLVLSVASQTQFLCGRFGVVTAQANELQALSTAKDLKFYQAIAVYSRGMSEAFVGSASAAVEMITAGDAAYRQTGATLQAPLRISALAFAYARLGEFGLAHERLGDALKHVETSKERWYEADVHRIAGEIVLMVPERDARQSQAFFERALSIARSQMARSLELRAATSLARLWRDQGRQAEARGLLAPVYGWFSEGLDTRDLIEAKSLLEELS